MDDRLLRAYRDTDYRINAATILTIRIGAHSEALDALLLAHGVTQAAFLTAWNPYSRPTPEARNIAAQARLAAAITAAGHAVLDGEGAGRGGDWPPEPSFLVLGISRKNAVALARRFGQNACIHAHLGAAAELIPTHP